MRSYRSEWAAVSPKRGRPSFAEEKGGDQRLPSEGVLQLRAQGDQIIAQFAELLGIQA